MKQSRPFLYLDERSALQMQMQMSPFMWKRYLLPVIIFSALALFVGYPILVVLFKSLESGKGIGLDVYARLFDDPGLSSILWNSIGVAFFAAILATLIGLCISIVVFKTNLPFRKFFSVTAVLPLIIPGFVATLAFIFLFGRNGVISYQWLGLDLDIYSWKSVLFVQIIDFTTISFLLVSAVMVNMDSQIEDAARNMGASECRVFTSITLPLLRPGIIASLILIFMRSMSDFGTPLLLGGRFNSLASASYTQLIGRYDMPMASALNVLLLMVCFLAFWFYLRAQSSQNTVRIRYATEKKDLTLPVAIGCTLWGTAFIFSIYILMIIVSVMLAAFTKHLGADYGLTLEYFRIVSQRSMNSIVNTVLFATGTAIAMSFLGMVVAYVLTRINFRGRHILEFLATLPFAVPGTFIGVGYIIAFNQAPLLLTGTWVIVFILVLVRELPLGLRSGISVLEQQDRSIDEASANLGANRVTTFFRIILPMARSALLVGSIYAFVSTIQTVGAIIFVITPGTKLLSVDVFEAIYKGEIGIAAALSVTMLVLSAMGVLAISLIAQKEATTKWIRRAMAQARAV